MSRWILGLGAALIGLTACSGPQRALPKDGPQTAAELLSAIKPPKIQTLQGQARLDAYVNGDRRSVGLLVVAKRPAQVQFQALAPTLDMLGLLSTDGSRFISYERGAADCLVGDACPRNLARFLPLPLPAEQMVAALLGDPPLLAVASDQQKLAWDAERGLYRLDLGPADAWHQQVFVAPGGGRPVGVIWYEGTERVASIQYDGQVDGSGMPRTVRVKVVKPSADMTIEMRDVVMDKPVDAAVFQATCPTGSQQVELPCQPK